MDISSWHQCRLESRLIPTLWKEARCSLEQSGKIVEKRNGVKIKIRQCEVECNDFRRDSETFAKWEVNGLQLRNSE